MTRMEIDVLIENFLSRHQQEGTCSEIKRTWYQLSNTISLGEYLKDVVAMANSDCDEGVIIIGIDEGTRLIHDSPLPLDEARLQEFVQKNVEPTPPIEFGEISRPEGRISYIQIMRRRDRPYVIKSEHAGNRIPLRRGSRVGFATRRDLDRWAMSRTWRFALCDSQLRMGLLSKWCTRFIELLTRTPVDSSPISRAGFTQALAGTML